MHCSCLYMKLWHNTMHHCQVLQSKLITSSIAYTFISGQRVLVLWGMTLLVYNYFVTWYVHQWLYILFIITMYVVALHELIFCKYRQLHLIANITVICSLYCWWMAINVIKLTLLHNNNYVNSQLRPYATTDSMALNVLGSKGHPMLTCQTRYMMQLQYKLHDRSGCNLYIHLTM